MTVADKGRGGPDKSRLHVVPPPSDTTSTLVDRYTRRHEASSVNQAVADKLWRLHWDYGYFTRAEIEAEVGPPRGRWGAAA
jgi:hypothetical protein